MIAECGATGGGKITTESTPLAIEVREQSSQPFELPQDSGPFFANNNPRPVNHKLRTEAYDTLLASRIRISHLLPATSAKIVVAYTRK